jgi:DNA-binding transcriptional MerR regulator
MQKLYYSISELSLLIDEEPHILRYWEKEFNALNPKKNRGGNRIYAEKEMIVVMAIKKLLRSDKLSIKGAKEQLDKLILNNEISQYVRSNYINDENIPDLSLFSVEEKTSEQKIPDLSLIHELKDLHESLVGLLQIMKE